MPKFKHPLNDSLATVIDSPTAVVVGGAIRDRLLGLPVLDIDIAVQEDPQPIAEKLALTQNGRAFPLDAVRGIYRVAFSDGFYVDLAKWQGPTLEADIDRRDFTINALAIPIAKWTHPKWTSFLIDRHQGLTHLKQKVLEPVSKKVFSDDPLRLMRALRISAEINFHLSKTIKKLIAKDKQKIKRSAPERIREEWLRLFSTERAHSTLQVMDETGLLDAVFPESKALRKTAPRYYGRGGVLKHTLDSVKYFEEIQKTLRTWFSSSAPKIKDYLNETIGLHPRHAHCKWALLLHDVGKPKTAKLIKGRLRFFEHEHIGANMVQKMSDRYRWSSEETQHYSRLVRNHMRPGNLATQETLTDKAIHRFFRDLGSDAVAMLLVSLADHLTYLKPSQRNKRATPHEKVTIKMIRRFYLNRDLVTPPRLVNGNDVMTHLQIPASPLVGTLLKELQEAQSEGKVKSKDDALNFLQNQYRKFHSAT